jgi:ATP-dependent RNA helicase DHX8/PRP22
MDSEPLNDKQPGSLTEAAGAKQAAVDSKIQAARERYLARKGKK